MAPGRARIVFRDAYLVAVDKPSGLCVHPTRGCDPYALLHRVRDAIGQRVYPVHRLDRSTSGIVLFALDPEGARRLGAMFTEQRIEKTYHAIVRGWPDAGGTIETSDPRPATTSYRRLATIELPHAVGRYASVRWSLLVLSPKSGRTHQLRRHLAHIRHPIVGDVRHGDSRHNRFARAHWDLHRLLLWATELRFRHPFTDAPVRMHVDPAPELHLLLAAMAAFAPSRVAHGPAAATLDPDDACG